MWWQVFRSLYLKVFLSMVILVAVILGMLFFVNSLKLKAMMTDAVASRLLLAIDDIEAGLEKTPGFWAGPLDVGQFQTRAREAMSEFSEVESVFLLGAGGARVLAQSGRPVTQMHLVPVSLRVMSPKYASSAQDLHGTLYIGRRILDRDGQVVGAVVLTAPVEVFGPVFRETRGRLFRRYLLVFILVSVALIPLVALQFRPFARAFKAYKPARLSDEASEGGEIGIIEQGNRAFHAAEAELDALLAKEEGRDND